MKTKYLIFFLLFLSHLAVGQQRPPFSPSGQGASVNPIRLFLNQFSLGLSSGYGQSRYRHSLMAEQLGGYYLQQRGDRMFLAFDRDGLLYDDWFQGVSADTATINGLPEDQVLYTDSSEVTFTTMSKNIPLTAVLYFDWNRIRLGGGVGLEFQKFTSLRPNNWKDFIGELEPATINNIAWRYFFSGGYNFYTFQSIVFDYHFVADFQAGWYNYGSAFDLPNNNRDFYFNIGLTMEKQYSEYFRAFLRPSYEFKKYEFDFEGAQSPVVHHAPAVYVQAGVFLKFPETPRCPIKACNTQVKHVHQGHEFRGQPIYKKQNRKYGENNRTLLKYKRRYRRR